MIIYYVNMIYSTLSLFSEHITPNKLDAPPLAIQEPTI